jgi:hypothetical protein
MERHPLFGQALAGGMDGSKGNQAKPQSPDGGFSAALGVQFGQDGIDMEFDCELAYPEPLGNRPVGQSMGHKRQNFQFPDR